MKDVLVTMAAESYRVRTQPETCRRCQACRMCRWGVVLTLVLAALSVATLAALTLTFCRQLEELRRELRVLDHRVTVKQDLVDQLRALKNGIADATSTEDPEEESDEDYDARYLNPTYPEFDHDDLPVEDKIGVVRPKDIPPLMPAAAQHVIARRSITPGRPRDPQLQLYHTLQTDSPPIATASMPARSGYLQYAERPAVGYGGTPPSWQDQTTPITTRRSRVMARQQYRRPPRPQAQLLLSQRMMQQANLPQPQDVPQDVAEEVTRSVESIDSAVEVEQTWRPYSPLVEGPAIAAHFVADSSRHRTSHHFDGNGRLKHPQGEYGDWRASSWVQELGLDRHFRLAEPGTPSGSVIVDVPGLYLVYAQVNYANEKDENGFWVYRNGHKELMCVNTASAPSSSSPRANTCFTAGVLHLRAGDRVFLRDLAGDRYRVLDHGGRSFIGLVNLQGCRVKAEQPSRVTVGQ